MCVRCASEYKKQQKKKMYIFICIELDGQVTHVPNRPTQSFVQHCDAGELCMFTAFW